MGFSMNMYLYKNISENNKVDKTLTNEREFVGTLKDGSSVINPIITLNGVNLSTYNYAYIPSFDRYYYIRDIKSIAYGLWEISMHVDVLMSFKTAIRASLAIIKSTEEPYKNVYMNHNSWATEVKDKTDIISFSGGLNTNGEYILITAGG